MKSKLRFQNEKLEDYTKRAMSERKRVHVERIEKASNECKFQDSAQSWKIAEWKKSVQSLDVIKDPNQRRMVTNWPACI